MPKVRGKGTPFNRRILAVMALLVIACIQAFIINFWNASWGVVYLIAGSVIMIGDAQYNEWRLNTPQAVVTELERWSIRGDSDIYSTGLWKIFHLGGVEVTGVSREGGLGCLIVPDFPLCWRKKGKNYHINVRYAKKPLEQLPPEVRETIEDEGLEEPYRWGLKPVELTKQYPINDEEQITRVKIETREQGKELVPVNEALTDMITSLEQRYNSISSENKELQEYLDGKFDRMMQIYELANQLNKEDFREKLKNKITGSSEPQINE